MICIAITPAYYAAIAATLELGTKLKALRGPGESYSDVILRLAKGDAGKE
jgi:predicted CopG family antitoxin